MFNVQNAILFNRLLREGLPVAAALIQSGADRVNYQFRNGLLGPIERVTPQQPFVGDDEDGEETGFQDPESSIELPVESPEDVQEENNVDEGNEGDFLGEGFGELPVESPEAVEEDNNFDDGSVTDEDFNDDPLGVPYESPEEVQQENGFSDDSDGDGDGAAESGSDDPLGVPYESPEEVQEENSFSDDSDGDDPAVDDGEEGDFLGEGANPSPDNTAAVAGAVQARQQATLRAQRQQKAAAGDWRVRLQLAPGADYLYKAKDNAGILAPLALTDGVIFPYTPAIEMAYKANYSSYDLTHSNFKGYFYQNSSVDAVNITATFTAQDSAEANYLLAVIHFFRSVTKMFYGQDAERGAPPPLVYLSGLGEYQFAEHPCVVSNFAYTLPKEVDYIRARSSFTNGTSLLTKRERQSVPSTPLGYTLNRLASVGLPRGAMPQRLPPPTMGTNSPTYVPTKIDMTITLLPMQSRKEVSSQFSLKNFANGNLLRGGFW